MKKFLLASGLFVMIFVLPSMVMASIVVTNGSFSYGNGGEFTVSPGANPPTPSNGGYVLGITALTSSSFQTFCLETNEFFSPGGTYTYVVNTGAKAGGAGGSVSDPIGGGTIDQISLGTAWLYYQFATGNLSSYFGSNRRNNAGALQEAIWYLENESTVVPTGNIYYDLAVSKFGAKVMNDSYGAFGVMALNLYDGSAYKQDMLWFDKSSTSAPIPPTVYLLGAGLLGLVGLRRKFKK